ncbi:MAG: DUF370 domain-containing protein [Clostridia bacterium]|nr:DUF370 domain-containing protein [Clostridia bacterium]
MYLHIGSKQNIRRRDIIGIFDADRTTTSSITRKYLAASERRGLVSSAVEEIPKSFVLYRDRASKKYRIVFSQLSTAALYGRMSGGEDDGTMG